MIGKSMFLIVAVLGSLTAVTLLGGCSRRAGQHRHHHGAGAAHAGEWLKGRLGLSPDQEVALERFESALHHAETEVASMHDAVREALLAATRADSFDGAALNDRLAEQETRLWALREALVNHYGRFHAALSVEQRERMVDLLTAHDGTVNGRRHRR